MAIFFPGLASWLPAWVKPLLLPLLQGAVQQQSDWAGFLLGWLDTQRAALASVYAQMAAVDLLKNAGNPVDLEVLHSMGDATIETLSFGLELMTGQGILCPSARVRTELRWHVLRHLGALVLGVVVGTALVLAPIAVAMMTAPAALNSAPLIAITAIMACMGAFLGAVWVSAPTFTTPPARAVWYVKNFLASTVATFQCARDWCEYRCTLFQFLLAWTGHAHALQDTEAPLWDSGLFIFFQSPIVRKILLTEHAKKNLALLLAVYQQHPLNFPSLLRLLSLMEQVGLLTDEMRQSHLEQALSLAASAQGVYDDLRCIFQNFQRHATPQRWQSERDFIFQVLSQPSRPEGGRFSQLLLGLYRTNSFEHPDTGPVLRQALLSGGAEIETIAAHWRNKVKPLRRLLRRICQVRAVVASPVRLVLQKHHLLRALSLVRFCLQV